MNQEDFDNLVQRVQALEKVIEEHKGLLDQKMDKRFMPMPPGMGRPGEMPQPNMDMMGNGFPPDMTPPSVPGVEPGTPGMRPPEGWVPPRPPWAMEAPPGMNVATPKIG